MRVALAYNLKKENEPDKPFDYYSEFDFEKTILAIKDALRAGGHIVELVEADQNIFGFFTNNKTDIVFNIAEGFYGPSRESVVPAILDFLNIPYTGSGVLSLALALDKAKTKQIFKDLGIPTPRYQVFNNPFEELDSSLNFPLIVKPNREGSAKGISVDSVVNDKKSLYKKIQQILVTYEQEVLVEEFIGGRELTVAVLSGGVPVALPILEIDFSNCKDSGEYFYSWRMKEYQGNKQMHLIPKFFCPARIDKKHEVLIKEIAVRAHNGLGCLDLSRADIRLSKDGVPYLLEINPLPGLDPQDSNFTLITKTAGIEYTDLINYILNNAARRFKLDVKIPDESILRTDLTLTYI